MDLWKNNLYILIKLTSILSVQIFPQCCHFGIDLRLIRIICFVLPFESQSTPDSTEGSIFFVRRLVLLVFCLLPHKAVFIMVRDANLSADDNHHIGHNLGVIHHYRLDSPVQHSDLQQSHLFSVLESVLQNKFFFIMSYLHMYIKQVLIYKRNSQKWQIHRKPIIPTSA